MGYVLWARPARAHCAHQAAIIRVMEWGSSHWKIEFRNSVVKSHRFDATKIEIDLTHFAISFRISNPHSVFPPDRHRRHSYSYQSTEILQIYRNSEQYFVKLLAPFASRSFARRWKVSRKMYKCQPWMATESESTCAAYKLACCV